MSGSNAGVNGATASITGKGAQPVYVIDFSVYKPPKECDFSMYEILEYLLSPTGRKHGYHPDTIDFILRIAERSGLGYTGTYMPTAINPLVVKDGVLHNDMRTALVEAEVVMGAAVREVLDRAGIKPEQVDILVTSTSIFCPTPSLASMLVNQVKLRSDIQAYHLGGMGCSNGVVGVGLVRDLLQARPNSIALFVPAEIVTYAYYTGHEKQFTVANCLFRMGGAAVLLTNKASYARTAKYRLQYNVRVHTGQDDESYGCMAWGPDGTGINAVHLGKNVPKCAAGALNACLRTVTPHILTWRQLAAAAANWAASKITEVVPYKPDFTECIDHFALHCGGYAVLKGVQKGMNLPQEHMLPSFATLRDYGNTSCSTTWYVMAYLESITGVSSGQKIMQVGLGGGMKAGVNIWVANRNIKDTHGAWAHLNGQPVRPEDLPRPIDDSDPAQVEASAAAKAAAKAAARAKAEAAAAAAYGDTSPGDKAAAPVGVVEAGGLGDAPPLPDHLRNAPITPKPSAERLHA
jgi:3-ketoacyl-CoA synthase